MNTGDAATDRPGRVLSGVVTAHSTDPRQSRKSITRKSDSLASGGKPRTGLNRLQNDGCDVAQTSGIAEAAKRSVKTHSRANAIVAFSEQATSDTIR
jgi:hypothetical protein